MNDLCPYSEETVAACRDYRAVSEHGDFPRAAHCQSASTSLLSDCIRETVCVRRDRGTEVRYARSVLIQACVNGSRNPGDHSALPLSPAEIAAVTVAVARAGAGAVHVHPRRPDGAESLHPIDVAAVCTAVRLATPHVSVGVTTAAWIEPDVDRRLALIEGWSVVPDFASVNLNEDGANQVIELLNARGIGVEAGVGTVDEARFLIHEGLDSACLRVLVEVEATSEPERAVLLARAIDFVLDDGLSLAPRLHHGSGIATWPVIEQAISHGHDVRVGLEDTLVLEDGSAAVDNASLVTAVAIRARAAGRHVAV